MSKEQDVQGSTLTWTHALCWQRLPVSLGTLTNLRRLSCHDNPTLVVPPPHVVEAGTEATMVYLRRSLELDCRHLCACCSRVVCLASSLQTLASHSAGAATRGGPGHEPAPTPVNDNSEDVTEDDW